MISGYRRVFTAPRSWEGRTLLLTIGAAAHDATVYCNGQRAGHHACGYTAFTVNLTGMVRLGEENVLAIRCDSRETLDIPPFGGQTEELTYGGLYRGVALEVKENAWLRDVFIQAGAEGGFRIYSAAEGETVGCTLEAEIRAPSGRRAVYTGELSLPITGSLNGVQPWSCEHPTLYTLTLRLIRPGTLGLPDRVLDQKVIRFRLPHHPGLWPAGCTSTAPVWSCGGWPASRATPTKGTPCPTASSGWTPRPCARNWAATWCGAAVRPARPSWTPATNWACWPMWRCRAAGTSAAPPGRPRPCRTAGEMVCQCRNHPQRLFVGGAGGRQCRRRRFLQKDQRGPPAGWTPPVPPPAAAGSKRAICSRTSTPTTIFPLAGPGRDASPGPPSPPTCARAI